MKIAIVGNSGSGKSTLACRLAANSSAVILDLDTVFWNPGPVERPSAERIGEVRRFCGNHETWIVEGCYADLIEATFPWSPELIFMDPSRDTCIANCQRRPHEPHKFRTKEEQDQNLSFLLSWVTDYYVRDGIMSYRGHKELFDRYDGPKKIVTEQQDAQQASAGNPWSALSLNDHW